MSFRGFSAFSLTLIVLVSMLGLGFTGSSRGSQLEDPYELLGLKAEYEYPPLKFSEYSGYLPLSESPRPLLLAKYKFLLEEILSPDKKWYSYLKERKVEDPIVVSNTLLLYVMNVVDGRRENFYYRFSWHVTGYDGSYYTVVLRLKMYYYDFVEKRVIYEFSEIVETVKVSVYDRRVIYECFDVGIWPFWLMPWERYEGAIAKLAEISPFFDFNNVTDPLSYFNLTFDGVIEKASLRDDMVRYFRDVLGIVSERVLNAKSNVVDPVYGVRGLYIFRGEEARIFGEPWLEAYIRMVKKYYQQLQTIPRILWGTGGDLPLLAPMNLYDAVTGVALKARGISDVFLMVIPLEGYVGSFGTLNWLIVSLTREPPPTKETATVTCPVIVKIVKTPTLTTPTETPTTPPPQTTIITTSTTTIPQTTGNTITPPIIVTATELERQTTVYPETTPEHARDRTTPATPPITPAKPPEPRRVEEAPGILSFEIAIAALTALAVSAAIITIIFRRGARGST